MLNIFFNVFISSSTMLQLITASASVLANNILVLIQLYYLYYVCQIVCFADICNVINVHWCDYCYLLNKLCHPVSSMQNIKKLLISRRFCSILMSPLIIFFVNIVVLTIRWQIKVITTAILCFVMQYRWFSSVNFKLIKLLL